MVLYDIDYAILKKEAEDEADISSLLRIGVEAEIDAIKLYEKMASMIGLDNPAYEVFQHIIEEEMEHVGEFQEMAERYSEKYKEKVEDGREHASEM